MTDYSHGVYLVNALGIVKRKDGKILIMKREEDPYIKELSWCFPGGRPNPGEGLEDALRRSIKTKTNVEVTNEQLIFARIPPEKEDFLSLYYVCDATNEDAKVVEQCIDIKWVEPTEVKKYFTTSIHPKIFEFLEKLEKGQI